MLTNIFRHNTVFVLMLLTTSGCLTGQVWRSANDPLLHFDGLDSNTTTNAGRRTVQARYSHGSSMSAESCLDIPLDDHGQPVAPFGISKSALDACVRDGTTPTEVHTSMVLAAGPLRSFYQSTAGWYLAGYEQWSPSLDGGLSITAYRIKDANQIQPLASFASDRPTSLPSDYHGLIVPEQRLRSQGRVMADRVGAAIATPFTLAVDGMMFATSPIWVPALIVLLNGAH